MEAGRPSGEEARYARLRDLLDLTVALRGSWRGLCLEDVMARYEVSRRTAHRMLRAVDEGLGHGALRAELDTGRVKRWTLRSAALPAAVRFEATELAALESAAQVSERDGRAPEAAALRRVLEKTRALLHPSRTARLDTDLEALIEAQGHAMRPGPRPRTDLALLDALRTAILACRKVAVHHRREEGGALRRQKVHPLGFLYGNRYYLVAWSRKAERPLLYRLSRIERFELLDESFEPPPGFSLQRFAENSFGVFQEEPADVVWRFGPDVAGVARCWRFHPSQRLEDQADGSLLVRMRAGGLLEMAWHLFTWGPSVEVVEPARLRILIHDLLRDALAHHRRHPHAAPPA
jgi:predicted DNA-binding transcriptional regulator YafY